jgi:hypothetical protein
MTATEIFGRMSSLQAGDVLNWLYENDRAAYRNCGAILASRRKLRPVFVERKPRDERNVWIKDCLSKPANTDLALELLQVWTLGKNSAMVCEFLDALEIPHDGKGLIDAIPSEPSSKVEAAVDALLEKNDPFSVFVYLHLFSVMDDGAWPILNGLLQTKPALAPTTLLVPL